MKGRKPKPSNLKLIEGNPGKRARNANEPKPAPLAPRCPSWLIRAAKQEWHRVAPLLERMGLLTQVDMAALAGYCQAYARWRECEEAITEDGVTYEAVTKEGYSIRARPEARLGQNYLAQVRLFCAEFGLTPSSRGRIEVPGAAEGAECPKCTLPVEICGCG